MSLNIFKIIFQPLEETMEELEWAVGNGESMVQAEDEMYFDSRKAFKSSLTFARIELLSVIASKSPTSVYQLAKMVERDQPNVQNDCALLEMLGFIVLEKSGNARNALMPRLLFDYDCLFIKGTKHIPDRYIQISQKAQKLIENAI